MRRFRFPWLVCLAVFAVFDAGAAGLRSAGDAGDAGAELVSLTSEDRQGMRAYYAKASRPGHFEIELRLLDPVNVRARPELPYRIPVSGKQPGFVVLIEPIDASLAASYGLGLKALPGRPMRASDAVPYRYAVPLGAGVPARIDQGPNGPTHDRPQSRYAMDFAVPDGTPVVAARGGLVVDLAMGYTEGALDPALDGKANVVRIEHDDGTMALYAHLAPHSERVRLGDRVVAGQRLADSGHTGYASGPHLHFAVQVNEDFELVSIPFELAATTR